ncbi:unnamed protein product [Alopecurus aequalis]
MDREGASRPKLGPGSGGIDLISALPADLLLQVLERLRFIRAAARTCILSRRWRGLWTHLPKVTVTLQHVPFGSLEAALQRAARPGLCHYIIDIRVPRQVDRVSASSVSSLLREAAVLYPLELSFTLPRDLRVSSGDVTLPCFYRATVIELHARDLHLSVRQVGQCWFHALEQLSLSGCHIDLATFIPSLRRLRRLSLNTVNLVGMDSITIHSASLDELVVEHKNRWTCLSRISVECPVHKQLTMSFHARGNLGVSILAPITSRKWASILWRCLYTRFIYGLGLWGISEVGLKTDPRHEQTNSQQDTFLQLPNVHVFSLHMCAQDSFSFPNAELSFEAEIDKHMVTNFSSLDLHLRTKGHVFGSVVLHILGLHRIGAAIRNLKINLLGSEVKDACPVNCLCDAPKDQRTQSISLANLEKVEIEGVEGQDHEFNFLKVIFRCAPMLKRVTVRLSDGVTPSPNWCTEIENIIKAYPVVECNIDLGPVFFMMCEF